MYQILTPGQKIKKLRMELGINQIELCNPFSHSSLSKVEAGKYELTARLAEAIKDNANKMIIEKDFKRSKITIEYLLESELEQATKVVLDIIIQLEMYKNIENKFKCFFDLLNDAQNIFNTFNIEKDIEYKVYMLSSEYFFNSYKYELSKEYVYKAMHIATALNNPIKKIEGFLLIAKNQYCLEYYKDSIFNLEYALYIYQLSKIDYKILLIKINFNLALAYKDMNEIKKAISHLNITDGLQSKLNLEEKELIQSLLSYSQTVRANISRDLSEYDNAKQIYINILKQDYKDPITVCRVHYNLALTYIEEKDFKNADRCIKIALDSKSIKNYYDLASQNYCALKTSIALNKDFKSTDIFFQKTLKYAEKSNTTYLINKAIVDMMKYCISIEKKSYLMIMLDKVISLVEHHYLDNTNLFKIFFMCECYFKNDFNKIKHIISLKDNIIKVI